MSAERDQLAAQLEEKILKLYRVHRSEVRQLPGLSIPWNEFLVLQCVCDDGPQMVSQLAARLDVTASHITSVSDRLISRGLMQRKRSQTDRRIVLLMITPAGQSTVTAMKALRSRYFRDKFKKLADEELELLITLLDKII